MAEKMVEKSTKTEKMTKVDKADKTIKVDKAEKTEKTGKQENWQDILRALQQMRKFFRINSSQMQI